MSSVSRNGSGSVSFKRYSLNMHLQSSILHKLKQKSGLSWSRAPPFYILIYDTLYRYGIKTKKLTFWNKKQKEKHLAWQWHTHMNVLGLAVVCGCLSFFHPPPSPSPLHPQSRGAHEVTLPPCAPATAASLKIFLTEPKLMCKKKNPGTLYLLPLPGRSRVPQIVS